MRVPESAHEILGWMKTTEDEYILYRTRDSLGHIVDLTLGDLRMLVEMAARYEDLQR